jgi:hypothetical protein
MEFDVYFSDNQHYANEQNHYNIFGSDSGTARGAQRVRVSNGVRVELSI